MTELFILDKTKLLCGIWIVCPHCTLKLYLLNTCEKSMHDNNTLLFAWNIHVSFNESESVVTQCQVQILALLAFVQLRINSINVLYTLSRHLKTRHKNDVTSQCL